MTVHLIGRRDLEITADESASNANINEEKFSYMEKNDNAFSWLTQGLGDPLSSSTLNPEPSLHEIKEKASTAAWASIRHSLRSVAVECSGMPIGQKCIHCVADAEYRCIDCASWAFYCSQCPFKGWVISYR